MSLSHTAGRAAFATAASLAALLFGAASAAAQPAPAPQDPGAANNAAPQEEQREEKPAENQDCGEWCEVIEAARQLPPPDFSEVGVPPLADVSVPVNFGLGLPDIVPDIPITLAPPALVIPSAGLPAAPRFQMPPPPPPPPLPRFDLTKLGQLPF